MKKEKILIIIAVVAMLLLGGTVLSYFLIFKKKDKISDLDDSSSQSTSSNKSLNNAISNSDNLKENSATPQTKIKEIVSKLKGAFYSGLFGITEDEAAIYEAYNMIGSRSDILSVEKEFGVYKDMTLKEHIYDLLSEYEIAHINEIISSKNIDYKY